MSNLFLFGAGASAYSGPCRPHSPPDGSAFFYALAKEGTAKKLDAKFGELFREHFESGMAAVRQDADEYTTPLIIQMARYLSSFEPDPANFYVQLFSNLKVLGIPFRIASTNYDLLIERSLAAIGSPTIYTVPPVFFMKPPPGIT